MGDKPLAEPPAWDEASEDAVRRFFDRYADLFNRALAGEADMAEVAALYAPAFIAAGPAGVMAGKNDAGFRDVMAQGYARYRAMGTKGMRVRGVGLSPIDAHHGVARVAWTATYARPGRADVTIDFEVGYLVQLLGGDPQVFGWVAGDEEALLRRHGLA